LHDKDGDDEPAERALGGQVQAAAAQLAASLSMSAAFPGARSDEWREGSGVGGGSGRGGRGSGGIDESTAEQWSESEGDPDDDPDDDAGLAADAAVVDGLMGRGRGKAAPFRIMVEVSLKGGGG
jgi:hypothetical protein